MRALVKTTGPLHIPTKLNCASVCVNTTFALSKKPFINVFFNNFYSFSYIYIGLAVHSVALRIFYNIFHIEHVKYMPCFLHMQNSHRLFMFCLSLFELFAIRLNSAVACVHRHFVSWFISNPYNAAIFWLFPAGLSSQIPSAQMNLFPFVLASLFVFAICGWHSGGFLLFFGNLFMCGRIYGIEIDSN